MPKTRQHGGRRPNAGRKPSPNSKNAQLSIKLSSEDMAALQELACLHAEGNKGMMISKMIQALQRMDLSDFEKFFTQPLDNPS